MTSNVEHVARDRVVDIEWGDGISSLRWSSFAREYEENAREKVDARAREADDGRALLCATSWDGKVKIYAARPKLAGTCAKKSEYTTPSPVLCAAFMGRTHVVTGGVDGAVRAFDLNTGVASVVGTHRDGASCVETDDEMPNMVFSASWDKTIKCWDLRVGSDSRCAATTSTPGKAYSSDVANGTFFLGTSDRQILAYKTKDLLTGGRPIINRQSSMKFQTRCVRGSPGGESLVVASVEGRVAVEYVDDDFNEKNRYAFKCHRKTEATTGETIYPVHAVSFHPLGTFATGGGDGFVNIWDGAAKKRLFQCPRYPTSISSLAFSPCGTMLAVASSYTHEEREKNTPQDRLYIRVIADDAEVTPKSRVN